MASAFFDVGGDAVNASDLRFPKAVDLAREMGSDRIGFAKLVECRKAGDTDWVVFDVEVELAQIRPNPILPSERMAAGFKANDSSHPTVLALRRDFPQVPHLNLHVQEYPRHLCLYAERYEVVRLSWTPARFVFRIREWLKLSARGDLHQPDQPLEPLLADFEGQIVLPKRILDAKDPTERLWVGAHPGRANSRRVFLNATEAPSREHPECFLASIHRAPPHTHGVIRRCPGSFEDLCAIANGLGVDLLSELRDRVKAWYGAEKSLLDARPLIVLLVPTRRSSDGQAEGTGAWAFLLDDSTGDQARHLRVRELGERIGAWGLHHDSVGIYLLPDASKVGGGVEAHVLNASFELTNELAAFLNGGHSHRTTPMAALGVGALGSQVVLNLARAGFGEWTLIDHDDLMPHNTVRHALPGGFVGLNKADATAIIANSIVPGERHFTALSGDVLAVGSGSMTEALSKNEVVLDFSTSVAVARRLACDISIQARRASLFLSPSGRDLVLLAEDAGRSVRLDDLEMQYYRAVVSNPSLEGHLSSADNIQRYGQSCRDVTSTLPQHFVAVHAGIAAGAIQKLVDSSAATISIWRTDDGGCIRRILVEAHSEIRRTVGAWTLVTDSGLLKKLSDLREERLPNETGGILLGSVDMERRIVYIADAAPSPPDSEEWPTVYIRGCEHLREKVDEATTKTGAMLEYVGEWHSHPRGASTMPSPDDGNVFGWIDKAMAIEGLPPTVAIIGDSLHATFLVGKLLAQADVDGAG